MDPNHQDIEITVAPTAPHTPDVSAMVSRSRVLMQASASPDEGHFLSVDELTAEGITLFSARANGALLGIGALADRDDYGEVKSLFTATDARGLGVAHLILERIEAEARAAGLPLLRLETSDMLDAAHRLFIRHDFTYCEAFGDYSDNGVSVFLEKPL
jgi:putative acetyltransferase